MNDDYLPHLRLNRLQKLVTLATQRQNTRDTSRAVSRRPIRLIKNIEQAQATINQSLLLHRRAQYRFPEKGSISQALLITEGWPYKLEWHPSTSAAPSQQ